MLKKNKKTVSNNQNLNETLNNFFDTIVQKLGRENNLDNMLQRMDNTDPVLDKKNMKFIRTFLKIKTRCVVRRNICI